jgi:hypothetical protein
VPDDNAIRNRMAQAPKLISSDATLLLMEAYETTYGIHNHSSGDVERPLAAVAMHPPENALVGSTLYGRIEQFAEFGVAKHFGLSFSEFLDLPPYVAGRILEVSSARTKLEGVVASGVAKSMEEVLNK